MAKLGINACILEWFDSLAESGAFDGQTSVLELGPQDFFFPDDSLRQIAVRRLGVDIGTKVTREIRDPATGFEARQALFYSVFGLTFYSSVDTHDARATYRQDLNTAEASPRRFDVVIDCGTTEHVFNLANVFVYTHNSLNVGGICLKVLPTFGDNTHGFYNIHPTVYFDIARENGYEVIDFRYIDDMISRAATRGAASLLSRSEIEGGLQSFRGCATIQERISHNFLDVLRRGELEGRLAQSHNAVDYCFVAMKKNTDRAFKYPGQGVYLCEFPKETSDVVSVVQTEKAKESQRMDDRTLEILFGEEFLRLWRKIEPFTMVSEERAFATYKACRHVAVHDIPGDFVECGVYRGGMAILACEVFGRYSKVDRHVWLFDTFEGMTQPEEIDADRLGVSARTALETEPQMCLATIEEVRSNLSAANYPASRVHLVKGDVLETLASSSNLPGSVAVLRLDTDWYASTKKELEVLYPVLSAGGIALVDDYGHWLGARKAVDEFVESARPPIYLSRTDSTGVEFVKPATTPDKTEKTAGFLARVFRIS